MEKKLQGEKNMGISIMITFVCVTFLLIITTIKFILGFRRGVKKSLIRLIIVAGCAGFGLLSAFLFTQPVVDLLDTSMQQSQNEYLTLGATMVEYVTPMIRPLIFMNVMWFLEIISWIIFIIVYTVIDSNKNNSEITAVQPESTNEETQAVPVVKPEKNTANKVLGGVISAAAALFSLAGILWLNATDFPQIVSATDNLIATTARSGFHLDTDDDITPAEMAQAIEEISPAVLEFYDIFSQTDAISKNKKISFANKLIKGVLNGSEDIEYKEMEELDEDVRLMLDAAISVCNHYEESGEITDSTRAIATDEEIMSIVAEMTVGKKVMLHIVNKHFELSSADSERLSEKLDSVPPEELGKQMAEIINCLYTYNDFCDGKIELTTEKQLELFKELEEYGIIESLLNAEAIAAINGIDITEYQP